MKKNSMNTKGIISKIQPVLFVTLLSLVMFSCIMDKEYNEYNNVENHGKINIKIEEFGSTDVKSGVPDIEVFSAPIELSNGLKGQMMILEENSYSEEKESVNVATKASSYTYTILVYKQDGSFVKKMSGTATDEGDFRVNNSTVSGTITTAGTYKFVCVANGTISSDNKKITFDQGQGGKSGLALMSDVITKNITSTQLRNNETLDLNFTMRHKEGAIRIKVDAEKPIPPGFEIGLRANKNYPKKVKYDLSTGTKDGIVNESKSMIYCKHNSWLGNTTTTSYDYFLDGTTISDFTVVFMGNTEFYGYKLNSYGESSILESDITGIYKLNNNKRYTIVFDFKEYNNLTNAEIELLPGWRIADRNLDAGNGFATTDGFYSSGYFLWEEVVKDIDKEWQVREGPGYYTDELYHHPTKLEWAGIVMNHDDSVYPTFTGNNAQYFPGIFGTEQENFTYELIQIGFKQKAKWYSAYLCFPPDAEIRRYPNYSLKLIDRNDYSKACAYRYDLYNNSTNPDGIEITVIYLGNEAKNYVNAGWWDFYSLFADPGSRKRRSFKIPFCGQNYGPGYINEGQGWVALLWAGQGNGGITRYHYFFASKGKTPNDDHVYPHICREEDDKVQLRLPVRLFR